MGVRMEIWKEVRDFEGIYEISSLGRVKILRNGNIKKNWVYKSGYAYIVLTKNKVQKTFLVHRIVAKAFIPNPDKKEQVNHLNCNKSDNRVSNLEWCSRSENAFHAVKNDHWVKQNGSLNHCAKLTETKVKKILIEIKNGCTGRFLSKKYKVATSVISEIKNNKSWKHVPR